MFSIANAWESPISHIAGSGWVSEEKAYDGIWGWFAGYSTPPEGWTNYLVLLLSAPTTSNKLRFKARYADGWVVSIDIDVGLGANWYDVYQGAYTHLAIIEKPFTKRTIDRVRARFYNENPDDFASAQYYEVEIWDTFGKITTSGDRSPPMKIYKV